MSLRKSGRALLALCLTAAVVSAHAQQYRWLDEKGRVQYSDTPPPPGAKDVRKKNLTAGPPAAPAEPFALQTARKNAPVKLYSSPDCGDWCDKARALLNKRGVPFTEINVSTTEEVDQLRKISGANTVPTMLVGSSVQKGFMEESYQQTLDAAGYPQTGMLPPRKQAAPPPPKPQENTGAPFASTAGPAPGAVSTAPPTPRPQ